MQSKRRREQRDPWHSGRLNAGRSSDAGSSPRNQVQNFGDWCTCVLGKRASIGALCRESLCAIRVCRLACAAEAPLPDTEVILVHVDVFVEIWWDDLTCWSHGTAGRQGG